MVSDPEDILFSDKGKKKLSAGDPALVFLAKQFIIYSKIDFKMTGHFRLEWRKRTMAQ
jgi:hypothetical protein